MNRFYKTAPAVLLLNIHYLPVSLAADRATPLAETSEDIVVTSENRKQKSQSVPIALETFSQAQVDREGIRTIGDLTKITTNAQTYDTNGGATPVWVIRGVGLPDFNVNNTPTAPIFLDDAYLPSNAFGSSALFDLQRVEVLKGPQSGLYGRNTIGGAIRMITAQPTYDRTKGYAEVSYGRWGDIEDSWAFNTPLGADWAVRIAGNDDHGYSGWQTSLATGQHWGAANKDNVRIEAAHATENSNFLWTFHAGRDDSQLELGKAVGYYSPSGGICPGLLNGSGAGCLTYANLQGLTKVTAAAQSSDGSRVLSDPINSLHNRSLGASFHYNRIFSYVTLSSVTSWEYLGYGFQYDKDATSQVLGHFDQTSPQSIVQQDVRLASNGNGRLDWLTGVNFAYEHLQNNLAFLAFDNNALTKAFGVLPSQNISTVRYAQDTRSGALYGQATYKLTHTLSVEGALRGTWEYKDYDNGSMQVGPRYLFRNVNEHYMLHNHLSGKIGLNWAVSPRWLNYVTVSRAYKSGGFFGGLPTNVGAISPYKEETEWAFEAGSKYTTPDRRLTVDGALFYYLTNNTQGFSQDFSSITRSIVTTLTNIGNSVNRGGEIDAVYRPLNGLSLRAAVGYVDAYISSSNATFKDYSGATVPYAGERLPFAPRWSLNPSVRYEREVLNGRFNLGGQLSYNYRSNLTAPRGLAATALNTIKGYGTLDAEVDFGQIGKGWTLTALGTNITNVNYRKISLSDEVGSYSALLGVPASYRISLKYSF